MARFLISAVGLALLLPGSAFGHAPSGVGVSFDLETRILQVTVQHPVKDAGQHYVGHVEVKVNDKKTVDQRFNSQVDGEHQAAVFMLIDAGVGDTIEVRASCSISGKKTGAIRVTAPKVPEE